MHGINPVDGDNHIEWGRISEEYAKYRPGYPPSMYDRLSELGCGVPGQRVLDLATGTGTIARQFARQGCSVMAIDIDANQIRVAKQLAQQEGLAIDFQVAAVEESGLPDESFDLISSGQSWLYFDIDKIIPEVKRMLAPGGELLTCHLCWLPGVDEIAACSEELVLKHNPKWSAANWDGHVPHIPDWAAGQFDVSAWFYYDEAIPFTRESWRGRFRACRGVGASLKPEEVAAFDREHADLLTAIADKQFTVLHRIDAHIFKPL